MMLTPHDKLGLLSLLTKVMDWLRDEVPTTTPCTACQNYRAGFCALDESAGKIPLDVAATGCDSWLFAPDSPPF